ncbi:MAG: sodium:alanine symporter family protein [Clostridia bacterium]|nr:sodium:alanine symporter family protein [Clostridia bacterium]
MQEFFLNIAATINTYLSNYILIILLVGIGLLYSIRTKFVQVRFFGEGIKRVFGGIKWSGGKQQGGISSFQALATAIAAQVGTGNIVGACGAILAGGPGAIFWMWIIAFLGMATIYAEAVLAQETKIIDENGQVLGGPVYYIKRAYNNGFGKFLAVFFAVAITLALGFMGAMVQSNSIASNMTGAFGIPGFVVGIILAVICAFIFLGGIQRIAAVAEKIVPFMAILYLLLGLIVLIVKIADVPTAFGMIFKYAFQPQAIIGGAFGTAIAQAISQGAKRGLFSNEAGMGSTPHAHAVAKVDKPHDQGVVAMIGVFIDTFIVLTMTALVTITCLYAGDNPAITADGAAAGLTKANMMQTAMSEVFGNTFGSIAVAVCLLFFAFTTIISWNFFGKQNVLFLFGKTEQSKKLSVIIYSVLAIIFIFLGTVASNDLVWELTDVFNNLMVIPNVIALAALSGIVVKNVKDGKRK